MEVDIIGIHQKLVILQQDALALWKHRIRGAKHSERRSAPGRKLPLISVDFSVPERPLPVKADVQILTLEISLPSDRYTRDSGR